MRKQSETILSEWGSGSIGSADRRFNEFRNLSDSQRQLLATWVAAQIDAGRKRARKPDAEARIAPLVGCIIANALDAMGEGASIHYSRGKTTYNGASPYWPPWLHSKQFIATIDGMTAAGLLQGRIGLAGPKEHGFRQSTFRPTAKLLQKLDELGITAQSVVSDDAEPVIFLSDRRGHYLSYDPATVAEESAELKAFNRFMEGHEVHLANAAEVRPGHSGKRLRRIYNRGSWDLGGRYYGAWWQNVPSAAREHILIDGQPTVELDYSSFVPRGVYHLQGKESPADPYEAPELKAAFGELGIPWEQARPVVKELFLTMINAKGKSGLHNSKAAKALPPGITYTFAANALERHNEAISECFYDSCGLTLMKKESEITRAIIRQALQEGIPILPIHDSFRVKRSDVEWLENLMLKYYENEFGFKPSIR